MPVSSPSFATAKTRCLPKIPAAPKTTTSGTSSSTSATSPRELRPRPPRLPRLPPTSPPLRNNPHRLSFPKRNWVGMIIASNLGAPGLDFQTWDSELPERTKLGGSHNLIKLGCPRSLALGDRGKEVHEPTKWGAPF